MHDQAKQEHDATHEASDEPYVDPVIEVYKRDIDQTMLDETLKLTPQQRVQQFVDHMRSLEEFRRAGEKLRQEQRG